MIKATLRFADGRSAFVIGLSRENTRRLHDGQPIRIAVHEVDPRLPELTVLLMAGETEQDIAAELRAVGAPRCRICGEPIDPTHAAVLGGPTAPRHGTCPKDLP